MQISHINLNPNLNHTSHVKLALTLATSTSQTPQIVIAIRLTQNSTNEKLMPPTTNSTASPSAVRVESPIMEHLNGQLSSCGHLNEIDGERKVACIDRQQQQQPVAATEAAEARLVLGATVEHPTFSKVSNNGSNDGDCARKVTCKRAIDGTEEKNLELGSNLVESDWENKRADMNYLEHENSSQQKHANENDADDDCDCDHDEHLKYERNPTWMRQQKLPLLVETSNCGDSLGARNGDKTNKQTSGLHDASEDLAGRQHRCGNMDGEISLLSSLHQAACSPVDRTDRKFGQLIEYNGRDAATTMELPSHQQAVVQSEKVEMPQRELSSSSSSSSSCSVGVYGSDLSGDDEVKVELGLVAETLTNELDGNMATSRVLKKMENKQQPVVAKRKINQQPDQSLQPDHTNQRGQARVAIPVTRKAAKPIQQVANLQKQQQQQRASYLKARSKSNLDQVSKIKTLSSSTSSLPRRAKQSIGQTSRVAKSTSGSQEQFSNCAINKSISSRSLAPESSKTAVSPLQQEQLVGKSSLIARSRSSSISSASAGFVTQIPSLISQSHAPISSTRSGAAVALGQNVCGQSKSMSNLEIVNSTNGLSVNDDSHHDQHPQVADEPSKNSSSQAKMIAQKRFANGQPDKVASGNIYQLPAQSNLPKAPSVSIGKLSTNGKGCLVSQLPIAISSSCMSLVGARDDREQIATGNGGSGSLDEEKAQIGQQIAIVHDLERCKDNNNGAEGTMEKNQGYGNRIVKQPQVVCAKCKSLQSELDLLIKEKKQMNEQINELEEMENDSRLMSQKFEQQLLMAEQHLESCKSELQNKRENESRLLFQNKRLNFELKQRLEIVEQLQCQVSRMQTRIALNKTSPEEGGNLSVVSGQPRTKSSNNNESNGDLSGKHLEEDKLIQVQDKNGGNSLECPILSANNSEDDDSAIEEFVKSQKTSLSSSDCGRGLSTQGADSDSRSGEQVAIVESDKCKRHQQAEDSAYSKSSASSDTNSDDGHRSDTDSQSSSLKDLLYLNVNTKTNQKAPIDKKDQIVEKKQTTLSPSSTSSGDESDHHENGPTNQSIGSSSPSIQVAPLSKVGSLVQQQAATNSNIDHMTSNGLTNRQQVLRKKISTARILRGVQVQQQQSATMTTTCSNSSPDKQQPSSQNNRKAEEPSHLDRNHSQSRQSATSCSSSQTANLIKQMDLPVSSSNTDSNKASHSVMNQTTTYADKNQHSKEEKELVKSSISTINNKFKGSLELALEGVDDLELGRTDEALKLLVVNEAKLEDADLIKQFRNEISSLKTRLLQAQTLNDNLVSKLNENRERFGQLTNSIQVRYNHQQQQPRQHQLLPVHYLPETSGQQPITNKRSEQDHSGSQRSIVYINAGVQATVEQQPYHHLATGSPFSDQQQVVCNGGVISNGNNNSSTCYINGFQYSNNIGNNQQVARLSFSLDEFIDTLKDLLEKVHFHHGRTFELVSECLKLAMNALLASYSNQMNLAHHNRVIMAGNKAIQRYPIQQQQGMEQLYHLHQQQDMYPVRPPPRRRHAASRMMVQTHYPADQLNEQSLKLDAIVDQPPQQPPTVYESSKTTAASALQAAKQTLFSIVPIYYNSNGGKQPTKTKGKKQPLV